MTCGNCQAAIPDESVFCLRCGAPQASPVKVARNGGSTGTPAARPAAGPRPAPARAAAPPVAGPAPAIPPGGKQAWSLSFKPLVNERLRYRVARWVCEQAPVHGLGEVQAALLEGGFSTFLALTAEEADTARQRLEALGAHPALWRLAPATTAEMLAPARPRPNGEKPGWTPRQKAAVVGIGLAALFVFGALAVQRYQSMVAAPPRVEQQVPR